MQVLSSYNNKNYKKYLAYPLYSISPFLSFCPSVNTLAQHMICMNDTLCKMYLRTVLIHVCLGRLT